MGSTISTINSVEYASSFQVTVEIEFHDPKRKNIKETLSVGSVKDVNDLILRHIQSPEFFHVEYRTGTGGGKKKYRILHQNTQVEDLSGFLSTRIRLYHLFEYKSSNKKIQKELENPLNKKGNKLSSENVDFVADKRNFPTALGKGRFGVVYLGEFVGERVAVKVLPIDSEDDRINLEKEVSIMKKSDHPNVLKCFGSYISNNNNREDAHVVMELCSGGTLFRAIHHQGILHHATDVELVDVMFQVSKGVEYLHRIGIIHRDIKSSNILLSWNRWKLSDFGSYKLSRSLRAQTIHGTPEYLAPEIVEIYDQQRMFRSKDVNLYYTHSVDIYSLGILFWEIWTKERIYAAYFKKYEKMISSTPMKFVQFLHKNDIRPTTTSERFQNCPDELKDLITRCWSKKPSDRPQNMTEITDILQRSLVKLKEFEEFRKRKIN